MAVFDAFMSYSHAADGQLAPSVQIGLQRLAKKVFARRALRVFRDQTGLSTNPHLWGGIEAALLQSEWFVLLASPESAASEWVNREVATWLDVRPLDRLMIVMTDGHLDFDADGRVDRSATDCLPPRLVEAIEHEPRWLDLRWARDETQLDLRNGEVTISRPSGAYVTELASRNLTQAEWDTYIGDLAPYRATCPNFA